MLQKNLIIAGCQLASRRQIGDILNKYFKGYQSSMSIELLIQAMELHYEGFSGDSSEMMKDGLIALISECGRDLHRDELQKLLKEV